MEVAIGFKIQDGPWGGGNQFATALSGYLKVNACKVISDLNDSDIDIILLTEPRSELRSCSFNHIDIKRYLENVNPKAIVIHRINECDERKGTKDVNKQIIEANKIADHTIFIGSWLVNLYSNHGWIKQDFSVILNGADENTFNQKDYRVWNGIEPLKIVTHHWGGSKLKGFDIYELLDRKLDEREASKKFQFTYIGNLPEKFQFKNANYEKPKHGLELAKIIKENHVYLTASQNEPAGMHHIEGALCGLPVLYRESGALPEYCSEFGISFNDSNFFDKLELMRNRYSKIQPVMYNYPYTAKRMCENYYNLFTELIAKRELILNKRIKKKYSKIITGCRESEKFIQKIKKSIPDFLKTLKDTNIQGKFYPCLNGATEIGKKISLGFSTFAVKLYYLLGEWENFTDSEKNIYIDYIKKFQINGSIDFNNQTKNAFIDRPEYFYLRNRNGKFKALCSKLFNRKEFEFLNKVVLAETKQALSTLYQINETPEFIFKGFSHKKIDVKRFFKNLDWSKPWGAGGQAAASIVFLKTQFAKENQEELEESLNYCKVFFKNIARKETGFYYSGKQPEYFELVNGSMKVLTALDWLNEPVHYPEKLIDSILISSPESQGCHLVDSVYLLYRCSKYTDYRKKDIEEYLFVILEMIKEHYNKDGGFSYYANKAQTNYYDIPISEGKHESDLHGTMLLTWAVSMIDKMLNTDILNAREIKN